MHISSGVGWGRVGWEWGGGGGDGFNPKNLCERGMDIFGSSKGIKPTSTTRPP